MNTNKNSKPHVALWKKLFANMGIKMADAQPNAKPGEPAAGKEHDLLRDGPQQQP